MMTKKITYFNFSSVTSTMDVARDKIDAGDLPSAEAIILADIQTGGKGRRGHTWVSTTGNYHMSFILPEQSVPLKLTQLPFVISLAASKALQPYEEVLLKWPNDLLTSAGKIGGIIVEAYNGHFIVGMGINLVSSPQQGTRLPAAFVNTGLNPQQLAERFYDQFDHLRDLSFDSIKTLWLESAIGFQQDVTVTFLDKRPDVTGVFQGLDDDGGLCLEGHPTFYSGDVSLKPKI